MENPWKSQKHIHNMFHDFPLKTANIHCRVWLLEGSQSCTIQYIIMSWQLQARPSSAVKLRHHPYLSCPRSHAQSGIWIHFPSYHTILQSFGSIKIYHHLNHQCHHCIFFQAHVFFFLQQLKPQTAETTAETTSAGAMGRRKSQNPGDPWASLRFSVENQWNDRVHQYNTCSIYRNPSNIHWPLRVWKWITIYIYIGSETVL